MFYDFDVVGVGAGHAGCEAALAASRMGAKAALLTMNLQVGSRIPIYNSAVGWAYIAGSSPEVREDLFEKMAKASGSSWKPTASSCRSTSGVRRG